MNTFLSSAFSGVSVTFLKPIFNRKRGLYLKRHNYIELDTLCSAILCGLVSISACGDCVPPFIAVFIGAIAGFIYLCALWFINAYGLDDVI